MVKNTRKNNKSANSKTTRKTNPQKRNFKKEIVTMFLKMLNTIKLYHWRTYSYATHEATDDLYADLNKYVDEFVEVMMGKMDNRNQILNIHLVKMNVPNNNNDFKKEIEYYKKFLIELDPHLKSKGNSDLLNIRDEILASLNKLLYLMTLR